MNVTRISCLMAAALLSSGCGDDSGPAPADDVTVDVSTDAASDGQPQDDVFAPDTEADADDPDTSGADTVAPDTSTPIEPQPGDPGPYEVGYRTETITYLPADGSPERSLRVVWWYPTDATSGDEALYAGLLPADDVFGDAPLAPLDAKAPVVVFSHGNSGFAEQSHFLTRFLATHGYVVVAPDHTTNTFADRDTTADIFHWRPLDIRAVLDHADALETPHFLADALSDARAISGHSFGGYTSLAATGAAWDVDAILATCANDPLPLGACDVLSANEALYRAGFADARIQASIPMSPGASLVFGGTGVADVDVPTLVLTGSLDRTTPNVTDGDLVWSGLEGGAENRRVDFATGAHFTFSNACDLPFDIASNDGCGEQFIDPAVAHRVINAFALAFLERHIRGDEAGAAILDGAVSLDADVTLSTGGAAD